MLRRRIVRLGAAAMGMFLWSGAAWALQVGSDVSGEAELAQRQIPLPEGEWTVAGVGTNTLVSGDPGAFGTIENAVLVRTGSDGAIDAVIELNVNRLSVQGGWGVAAACTKTVSLSAVAFYKTKVDGFCLFVAPTDLGVPNAPGPDAWTEVRSILHADGATPSPTWLTVGYRVSDRGDVLDVRYHFDPKALGLEPVTGDAWTLESVLQTPDRYAALNQLNAWGGLAAGLVEDGFRGALDGRMTEAPLPNPWEVPAARVTAVDDKQDAAAPAAAAPIGQVSPSARIQALDALLAKGAISPEDHAAYMGAIRSENEKAPETATDYYSTLWAKVVSYNFFRVSVDYLLAFVVTVNSLISGYITAAIVATHSVVQVFNDMWWDSYILSTTKGETVDFVYIGAGKGADS